MTDTHSSTNQHKTEPVPPSSAQDGAANATSPGPRLGSSDGADGAGSPAADSLGEAHQVPVASDAAAAGTSEADVPVEGVTAIAPEGRADGEPDTPAAPTSTF